jgi:hypothetical protein
MKFCKRKIIKNLRNYLDGKFILSPGNPRFSHHCVVNDEDEFN